MIHNERYLDMNTFERLLMLHTIEHNIIICSVDMLMSKHYAHTTLLLTSLILDTSSLMDEIDVRCLLKLLCSQFPFVTYKSRLQCHSERCNPKAILECSCIDSPGQDASKSQLPSQQCWYTFAAEYTEANWGQMKLPRLQRRTMPSVRIDPMILEP